MKELTDPRDMFRHLYSEMPPYLKRQQEELERFLKDDGEEVKHG